MQLVVVLFLETKSTLPVVTLDLFFTDSPRVLAVLSNSLLVLLCIYIANPSVMVESEV